MNVVMDIPEEAIQKKMFQMAKHLSAQIEPIALFEGKTLYKVKNHLFYDDNVVIPEFYSLMSIPFSLSVSVEFSRKAVLVSESERPRRRVVNGLLRYLKAKIVKMQPDLKTEHSTVRAAWVIEFGRVREGNERHCHILLHFHRELPSGVVGETLCHLKSLGKKQLLDLGIRSLDVQMIAGKQSSCVSYFCKKENGENFKTIEYSSNFRPIIERLFVRSPHPILKMAA